MNQSISNKVTVLVFKDNYAARTFQIPLSWISRFGIFLGILTGLAAVSAFVAVKYYRVAEKADLTHVQDLEQELSEARANLKILEAKALESASTPISSVTTTTQPPATHTHPTTSEKPTVPPLSQPNPSADVKKNLAGVPVLFSAFPTDFKRVVPDPSTLPFSVKTPMARWRGKTLKVSFALQYTKTDQGFQQGKILVLARGSNSLFIYPQGAFNRLGNETLININKGESFSVGRYREVKAEFGPVKFKDSIQDIEIFILNNSGELISYQKLMPQSQSASIPIEEAPSEDATPMNSMINPAPSPTNDSPTQIESTRQEGNPQ